MKESDVVLTPIPLANGIVTNRPAIVLREMPPFRDLLDCGVSTQLHQEVKGFDDIISASDADFSASGLKTDSLVRLGYLAVLPRAKVIGVIGAIAAARHKTLLKRLGDYLVQ